ncbi:MAG: hypothetical protein AAFU84_12435, partial [Cyanobacteria bacterium J06633_23]
MKIANPLHYPLAVLAGGLFLIVAARVVRLPALVAVPGGVAIATVALLFSWRLYQLIGKRKQHVLS